MKASVKYRVINRFKDKYNVRDMCIFFGVSRSGYYAWTKKADKEDPDKQIGELIRDCKRKHGKHTVTAVFRYGYCVNLGL